MSLDAPKSDAELIRLHAERTAGTTLNGVRLGPGSPMLPAPAERGTRAHPDNPLTEHAIQAAAFERINDPTEQLRRPALALVHAVPNGGARTPRTAGKLKAEGVKPGVPDIDCPAARGGYHGLRIEVKKPGEATKPAQADWLYQLAREGYLTALHTTSEGIWAELINYLDSGRTVVMTGFANRDTLPAGPSSPE